MQQTIGFRRDLTPRGLRIPPRLSLSEFVDQCVERVDLARRELVIREDLAHIGVMRAALNLGFSVTIAEREGRPRVIVHAGEQEIPA